MLGGKMKGKAHVLMMDLGALLKTKNAGTESLLKCATAECVHKCDTETISQI